MKFNTISRKSVKNGYGVRFVVIPTFVSNPESIINVRVITIKDQLERTVKTLHKAGTLHIEISEELEAFVCTGLEKEQHTPCSLIDDIIIYVQTGKHTYLEGNIKPIYSRPFRESEVPNRSIVKWN